MSIAEAEARELQRDAPSGLWHEAWERLRRDPGAIAGGVLVAGLGTAAAFAGAGVAFVAAALALTRIQREQAKSRRAGSTLRSRRMGAAGSDQYDDHGVG